MIFSDSVCFDITISGEKKDVAKLVSYLKSGELDEFFEIDDDLLFFDDNYETSAPDSEVRVIFSSDEFGLEVDEFDADEFLEVLCKAGRALLLKGSFYNFDDDEIRFVSEAGDDYYTNEDSLGIFDDDSGDADDDY